MFESARAASGASAVVRCEIITDHGPGEASDLLRGGLGGPGLGLDVLEDCAPSAALLLLVGHDFPDSEALLATRGAHLPEAPQVPPPHGPSDRAPEESGSTTQEQSWSRRRATVE